jgi:hypothetical protein
MIPILPLRLTFTLHGPLRLPRYPGSLWRSALGASLRRQACITGAPTCENCPFIRRCAYGFLFDTPQPANATDLAAQYTQLPHPYVVSPRSPGGVYRAGDTVTMDLIVIAPGHRFMSGLLAATANLRLGPTALSRQHITLLPPATATAEGEATTSAGVLKAHPASPKPPPAPARARIEFEHPLRLRRANRYLRPDTFDFAPFFTTLMRRIHMLHALTGASVPAAEPQQLAEQARAVQWQALELRWFDWFRRSARQKKRIPEGGITGAIQLDSGIEALWPWLWAGQWLHVGKGAVMGLVRYRLQPL